MITLACPQCGHTMHLDDGFAGGVCRCSECSAMVTVPKELGENAQRIANPSAKSAGSRASGADDFACDPGLRRTITQRTITHRRGVHPAVIGAGVGGAVLLVVLAIILGSRSTPSKNHAHHKPARPPEHVLAADVTMDVLREAMPDAPDDFLMEQMSKGYTLAAAQSNWSREKRRLERDQAQRDALRDQARQGWVPLTVSVATSKNGATLRKQADQSVIAFGAAPDTDVYTVRLKTPLSKITALRLEALPHPSLPHSGPGRAENGNFVLSHFAATARLQGGEAAELTFESAVSDYSQPEYDVGKSLNTRDAEGWAVDAGIGQPHEAVYVLKAPTAAATDTELTVTLRFGFGTAHSLGRFRLSATTMKSPPAPRGGEAVVEQTPPPAPAQAAHTFPPVTLRRDPNYRPASADQVVHFDLKKHFTDDLVVNGYGATMDREQNGFGNGLSYVTRSIAGYLGGNADGGLPNDGRFAATAHHPEVELAYRDADSGKNAVVLNSGKTELKFDVPQAAYRQVHLFMATGGGDAQVEIELLYDTGASFRRRFTVDDRMDDAAPSGEGGPLTPPPDDVYLYTLIDGLDVSPGGTRILQVDDAAIFGYRLPADAKRKLKAVRIRKTDSAPGEIAVWGALGETPAPPLLAGQIEWELWNAKPTNSIAEVDWTRPPDEVRRLSRLEAPRNVGEQYGARMRGYIIPPRDGDYTFYIASDNGSQLWLSRDEDPKNKSKIAFLKHAQRSALKQWDALASQTSKPVRLLGRQRYYFEVLHHEEYEGDHLAVAWSGGGLEQQVIEGRYLVPWNFKQQTISLPEPVAHYKFDGNAQDAAGERHAVALGGVSFEAGRFGQAAHFKSKGDGFRIDDHPTVRLGRGEFTVSLWVKAKPQPKDTWPVLWHKEPWGFFLGAPNQLHFEWKHDGTKIDTLFAHDKIVDDSWHHVAAVKRSNTMSMYLDGGFVGDRRIDRHQDDTRFMAIGTYGDASDWSQFFGAIDDLRLYKQALNEAQLLTLAAASDDPAAAPAAPSPPPAVEPKPAPKSKPDAITRETVQKLYQEAVSLRNEALKTEAKWRLQMRNNVKPPSPGTLGRYVKISLEGKKEFLHLKEVEVISTLPNGIEANVARKAKPTQSSREGGDDTSVVIDGRHDDDRIFHTKHENDPWLLIDLGDTHPISRVVLWNRTDCCSERLDGFTLQILDDKRQPVFTQKPEGRARPNLTVEMPKPKPDPDYVTAEQVEALKQQADAARRRYIEANRKLKDGVEK